MIVTKRRAQSAAEYAVLISGVILALLAMQTYIQRGMHGRLKQQADSLGKQYDAQRSSSNITTNYNSQVTTNVTTEDTGTEVTTTTDVTTNYDNEHRTGTERVN